MTNENQELLKNLYNQYMDPVKPLLAEIEAIYEKFPIALFNEIRALNDHVARAYTAANDEYATEQIKKASNHINRITRDCYKFLNLYYKQEAERFDKSMRSIDPKTRNEYKRMLDYEELSDKAIELVEYAKQNEHSVTDFETYRNFENSYLAYKDLHKFITKNRREVMSMQRKKFFGAIGSIALSIFTFILGCLLTNNNLIIIEAFHHIFH